MEKKKWYYAGFFVFLLCLIFFNIVFYFKHGGNYLRVDQLYIGIPLWSILLGYTAYGSLKYYYTQKELFLPECLATELRPQRENEWKAHKYLMLSKGMRILGTLFGMAAPFYLLAYREDVEEFHATPFKIVCFVLLTIVCLVGSYLLKKKYLQCKEG